MQLSRLRSRPVLLAALVVVLRAVGGWYVRSRLSPRRQTPPASDFLNTSAEAQRQRSIAQRLEALTSASR